MNLDELKSAWQAVNAQQLPEQQVSVAEIRSIIRSQSSSLLERINRTIITEVAASLLLAFGGMAYMLFAKGKHIGEVAFIAVYLLASLIFYLYKYRALNSHKLTEESLSISLTHLVRRTQQFLRIYDYMIVIGMPIGTIIGFVYGLYYAQEEGSPVRENMTPGLIAVSIALLILVGGAWMWFSKWYVNRIYGKPFRALQDCLAELEESEK